MKIRGRRPGEHKQEQQIRVHLKKMIVKRKNVLGGKVTEER
jgi:hypothetical protein